jgi:hypothetical protein
MAKKLKIQCIVMFVIHNGLYEWKSQLFLIAQNIQFADTL